MVDDSSIKVSSDDNLKLNLEIISQSNSVSTEFTNSINSVIAGHDDDETAHENIITNIDKKIELINETLDAKQNLADSYTKEILDTMLAEKYSTTDTIVTAQGNEFNSADQLVKLDASGKLPAIDGSKLTAFPASVANSILSNVIQSDALSNLGFGGYSLASNGYYKFPNGLILQWGYISATTATTNQIITFPVAFSNDCLFINTNVQFASTSTYGGYYTYVASKTTTNFTITYTMSRYWFAIGY